MDERRVRRLGLPKIGPESRNATLGQMRFRQNPSVNRRIHKSKALVVEAIDIGNPDGELRARGQRFPNPPK